MKTVSDATPAEIIAVLRALNSFIGSTTITPDETLYLTPVHNFYMQLRRSIKETIRPIIGSHNTCNKAIVATIDSLIEEITYHAEDYPEDVFPFSLWWDDLDSVVDNNVDTSTYHLINWLHEELTNAEYVNEAIKKSCTYTSAPPMFYDLLQSGQHAYLYSVVAVTASLLYTFLDALDYDETFNLVPLSYCISSHSMLS